MCGNKNCIGILGSAYGHVPEDTIIIEDLWDTPVKVMYRLSDEETEEAMVGLLSHETVEYLLLKLHPELLCDLHTILGHGQEVENYVSNADGIVLGHKECHI